MRFDRSAPCVIATIPFPLELQLAWTNGSSAFQLLTIENRNRFRFWFNFRKHTEIGAKRYLKKCWVPIRCLASSSVRPLDIIANSQCVWRRKRAATTAHSHFTKYSSYCSVRPPCSGHRSLVLCSVRLSLRSMDSQVQTACFLFFPLHLTSTNHFQSFRMCMTLIHLYEKFLEAFYSGTEISGRMRDKSHHPGAWPVESHRITGAHRPFLIQMLFFLFCSEDLFLTLLWFPASSPKKKFFEIFELWEAVGRHSVYPHVLSALFNLPASFYCLTGQRVGFVLKLVYLLIHLELFVNFQNYFGEKSENLKNHGSCCISV